MKIKLMEKYKYHLDKSSKKFKCPRCGKTRFVKYKETETGYYAESQHGRCDREVKCGYSMYPNSTSIMSYNYVPPPPVKPSYIEYGVLKKTLTSYETNPLVAYLHTNYSKDEVKKTIEMYQVGTAEMFSGAAVFWQMDNTGNIRSGKIMAYNTSTGKRIKNKHNKPLINWVHTALHKPNYNLKQCLFGLHLLNENVNRIAIVESEKTAIIMSIEFPRYTWMTTGSLQGFKQEYLEPIKKYDIIAFPDKGCYLKWQETATELNKKGFVIEVSEFLENSGHKEGWDLVDVIQYESSLD